MTMKPLFDHALLFKRQAKRSDGIDFLSAYIGKELSERLSIIDRTFENAFQLNGSERDLAVEITKRKQAQKLTYIDQIAAAKSHIDAFGHAGSSQAASSQAGSNQADYGHAEHSSMCQFDRLPDNVLQADLILSPLTLHLTNDTPGMMAQIFSSLKADGLLFAASLGAGTLSELRDSLIAAESEIYGSASARIIPFADIKDYGGLLQRAGFALPVIDSETLTVRYDHMFDLMKDLRAMGMANPLIERSKRPVHRRFFQRAAERYQDKFSDPDGRIRASFNVIYLSGWKPHESQQKPLKPGSATNHLSEVLGSGPIN